MAWAKTSKTNEPENLEKAYEYSVFLLSLQLRTEGEVREKMGRRGYTSDTINIIVKRLVDQKYLNDQKYAEVYLENLKQYKNFGFYGIKKKFMEKKLPPNIIESILKEGLTVVDEIKIAKRFLKKEGVVVKPKSQDDENQYNIFNEELSKEKEKLITRLKARGFRGEVVARLVF